MSVQSYAQQLQENERRLAELMRVEHRLRRHHRGTTQQRDSYDADTGQGEFTCMCYNVLHAYRE